MNSVKKAIKLAFNRVGLDIRRADRLNAGEPSWSNIDYPIDPRPRWGHGRKPHSTIEQQLTLQLNDFKKLLADFGKYKSTFSKIPFDSASPISPIWNNMWFSTLDAASLVYFIAERAPKTYLEIGSGFSTKFARAAISATNLSTKLISIDPNPRTEIDSICDEIIRKPLEDVDLSIFDTLEPGDIAFFDGTHRLFTNSDTTVFLLDVLPRLKRGILVHFHDIFWPDDYIPAWNPRLYSEQYALGAMIIGAMSRFRIVLPNYFVSTNPVTAPLVHDLGIPPTYPESRLTTYLGGTLPGLSFWLEVL
jgi:Methyltransferase domain